MEKTRAYEEEMQLLSFDVVRAGSKEPALFQSIQHMARDEMPTLHRLKPLGSSNNAP
jgi:hypothetical protein